MLPSARGVFTNHYVGKLFEIHVFPAVIKEKSTSGSGKHNNEEIFFLMYSWSNLPATNFEVPSVSVYELFHDSVRRSI